MKMVLRKGGSSGAPDVSMTTKAESIENIHPQNGHNSSESQHSNNNMAAKNNKSGEEKCLWGSISVKEPVCTWKNMQADACMNVQNQLISLPSPPAHSRLLRIPRKLLCLRRPPLLLPHLQMQPGHLRAEMPLQTQMLSL
jgi:hypothetical protein